MGSVEREAAAENPDAFAKLIEGNRERFERGEYEFAVLAVRQCLQFGLAIPEWLESEVAAAMVFYFKNGGAETRGSKGNLAKTRRTRIDVIRYRIVERERDRGMTKDEAIERASELLSGKPARGSVGQIRDSYDRVAPRYPKSRKPGRKRISNSG